MHRSVLRALLLCERAQPCAKPFSIVFVFLGDSLDLLSQFWATKHATLPSDIWYNFCSGFHHLLAPKVLTVRNAGVTADMCIHSRFEQFAGIARCVPVQVRGEKRLLVCLVKLRFEGLTPWSFESSTKHPFPRALFLVSGRELARTQCQGFAPCQELCRCASRLQALLHVPCRLGTRCARQEPS